MAVGTGTSALRRRHPRSGPAFHRCSCYIIERCGVIEPMLAEARRNDSPVVKNNPPSPPTGGAADVLTLTLAPQGRRGLCLSRRGPLFHCRPHGGVVFTPACRLRSSPSQQESGHESVGTLEMQNVSENSSDNRRALLWYFFMA